MAGRQWVKDFIREHGFKPQMEACAHCGRLRSGCVGDSHTFLGSGRKVGEMTLYGGSTHLVVQEHDGPKVAKCPTEPLHVEVSAQLDPGGFAWVCPFCGDAV